MSSEQLGDKEGTIACGYHQVQNEDCGDYPQNYPWKTQLRHLFLNRKKMKKLKPRDNDTTGQCVETSFTATEPMHDNGCLPMTPSSACGMWYKEQG